MNYRRMKNSEKKVSSLGFGCMRLPAADDRPDRIKTEKAAEMLDYALENGVNYLDTAWFYHRGESENFLGSYLQSRDARNDIYLATKLPTPLVKSKDDLDYFLQQQLKKLQTNYIDFYLLHSLREKSWKKLYDIGITDWLLQKKEEGLINHPGFSFHDDFPAFKKIIDSFPAWDFCQIQYNYLDRKYQAGEKGLDYAWRQDLDVVIMEPLRGGLLARKPPRAVEKIWEKSSRDISPAARALEWLWQDERIAVVLSGMNNIEEVKENVATAARTGPGSLPQNETELINKAAAEFKKISPVDCTGCSYCTPCPEGVRIPKILDLYNNAHIYDGFQNMKEEYYDIDEDRRADACIKCQRCEGECPQDLPVSELMKRVENYF
ncbi:aldo/keto reductase [Halarsenatibacter silvermanii]|uniref:4Fe-4S ferredoxin-type domain-containing protein n=1 Tax=Halarsenatibacter silvermanii TaxID=321763 RepID=A0A1G9SDJ8_9FIRM|nr:aldo/keto reductase [Halarsenatibacter silvermanii]SDM33548.1 hypothetical protein SAMN04488692_1286 [Halarsenatibacter silvermanii]